MIDDGVVGFGRHPPEAAAFLGIGVVGFAGSLALAAVPIRSESDQREQ